MIQTFPLLYRLKAESRETELTLVCSRSCRPVAELQSASDNLLPLDYDEVSRLATATDCSDIAALPCFRDNELLRREFDLVVNLTHDEGSATLCKFIRSRTKTGRIRSKANEIRLLGDWAKYFFAALNNRSLNLVNLVDLYMGIAGVRPKPGHHHLRVSAELDARARRLLLDSGYQRRGILVGLQLGSNDARKIWPVREFVELTALLQKEEGVELVLLGSKEEEEPGGEIAASARHSAVNLVGKTSVRLLLAVLKHCDLLVSNDTGTIHLAAAAGIRTLGLYVSSTYFGDAAPYGEGQMVLQGGQELDDDARTDSAEVSRLGDDRHLPARLVFSFVKMILGREIPITGVYSNVGAYSSRFLEDGSLVYAPIEGAGISERYTAGVLNRIGWGRVLGAKSDPVLSPLLRARLRAATGFEEVRGAYLAAITELGNKFNDCASLIDGIRAESRRALRKEVPLAELLRHFKPCLGELAAIPPHAGHLRDFFLFELMDVDQTLTEDFANVLKEKFRKLERISRQLRAAADAV